MADTSNRDGNQNGSRRRSGGRRQKLGNDPLSWMNEDQESSGNRSRNDQGERSTRTTAEQSTSEGFRTMATSTGTIEKKNEAAGQQPGTGNEVNSIFMHTGMENARTGIMMCDTDMNIVYVNPAVVRLLGNRRDTLRQEFPGFDPDNLVGQSIDQFHKDRSHQRAILQNPARLPYEARISIADLRFQLNASAIMDANGTYMGNMVEWLDVTEQEATERERDRMQGAVKEADTGLMMCDENMDIVYVNPAVVETFRARRDTLRREFPGFDPDNLVGQSIDQFHQNPAHQRAILQNPDRLPYQSKISVADLRFNLNATAIIDSEGSYAGNMVEWQDITDEERAKEKLVNLIQNIQEGKLDERIDTGDMAEGFVRQLSENINTLIETVETPIREVMRVMQNLSQGDLQDNMNGEYKGDLGRLQGFVNETVDILRNIVDQVAQASGNIDSAAKEIAQGNQDLSQRTEEQASSLEETASSMEELTSTVKQNADNAQESNQLANAARAKAERGGEIARQVVEAMGEIKSSSSEISDIITVIDEIAFQTNLLALNAAVEAARAGEHGRGFGVVAAEVRNLAQRSASAAKDIKKLIKDSGEKVEHGTKLVDESTETLNEIMQSVQTVTDKIAEIAAASNEQSEGIDGINKAVTQLDDVTQQNASLVEEAAAAAQSMDDQTTSLVDLMSFFGDAAGDGQQGATSKPSGAAGSPRQNAGAGGNTHSRQAQRPNIGNRADDRANTQRNKTRAHGNGGNSGAARKTRGQAEASDDGEWEEF